MGRGRRRNRSKSRKKSSSNDHAKKNEKEKPNTESSCKVMLLPEDLMFDILSYVPPHHLFQYARYVCKSWASIIASSRFTEAYFHLACSKPGLYVHNFMSPKSSYFLDIKDDDVNGLQFQRTELGVPSKMGHLINTCDGILLFHNLRTGSSFVVNPILKQRLEIPPLPYLNPNSYVDCQFTIARVPHTSEFKLFCDFYVLRIGIDNSWKKLDRKQTHLLGYLTLTRIIYGGGNDLYWTTRIGASVMDVDKEIIVGKYLLPSSPEPYDDSEPQYALMENKLSAIVSNGNYTRFLIYILDIDLGGWTLYHEIGPLDYVAACGNELKTQTIMKFRFWINDQIVFKATTKPLARTIVTTRGRIPTIHFGYNVKTRQLTKIKDIDIDDEYRNAWLHTNSLVSLSSTST